MSCKAIDTMLVGFDTCKVGSQTLITVAAFINSTFSSIYTKTMIYQSNQ